MGGLEEEHPKKHLSDIYKKVGDTWRCVGKKFRLCDGKKVIIYEDGTEEDYDDFR